jgi:hypothetical protein
MSKVTFKTDILPTLKLMKELAVIEAGPEINMEIKVSKNKRIVYKANIKLNCKYSAADYKIEKSEIKSESKLDDENKKFFIDTLKAYENEFNKKLEDTILQNQAGFFTEKITESL